MRFGISCKYLNVHGDYVSVIALRRRPHDVHRAVILKTDAEVSQFNIIF